jgi:hypothetical protein
MSGCKPVSDHISAIRKAVSEHSLATLRLSAKPARRGPRALQPGYASVRSVTMWKSCCLCVALLSITPLAKADEADSLPDGAQPEYGKMPMASEGSNPRLERRLSLQSRHRQDRTYRGPAGILGFEGGVPIFVGDAVDRDVFKVGGSITGFGGVDFGFGTAEISVGYQGSPTDPPGMDGPSLQRVALGVGGRVQFPNKSILIPFLGFGFAAQWWKYDAQTGCALVVCSTGNRFRFAPGFNVRAGASILLGGVAAIEIGARYNLSFEGNGVSTQNLHFIEPTLGFRFWL